MKVPVPFHDKLIHAYACWKVIRILFNCTPAVNIYLDFNVAIFIEKQIRWQLWPIIMLLQRYINFYIHAYSKPEKRILGRKQKVKDLVSRNWSKLKLLTFCLDRLTSKKKTSNRHIIGMVNLRINFSFSSLWGEKHCKLLNIVAGLGSKTTEHLVGNGIVKLTAVSFALSVVLRFYLWSEGWI